MNCKSSLVFALKSVLLSSALLVMLVSLGCSEGNGASTSTKLVDKLLQLIKLLLLRRKVFPPRQPCPNRQILRWL